VYNYREITADAKRALRMVRAYAKEWGIEKDRIGIMGSSAGGHLASTMMTQPDGGDAVSADSIERFSSRPDFGILCYPVISMGPLGHRISREQFLGLNPSEELIRRFSNELHVTPSTPPCFIWHTYEDSVVSVRNSLEFAQALQRNGVPFDLHVYEKGRHGLGLGDRAPFTNLHPWVHNVTAWLRGRDFIR
jgi:acetyl esterase/lipase